jgi:hypothetical protein
MNLPLHFGLLGVLEAGLIAFAVGVAAFALWRWLARLSGFSGAQAIGWACVCAVAAGAGWDAWNLFYLGMVKLESPLYARLALQGVHDPDSLGARVVCETAGALSGVVAAWLVFGRGSAEKISPPTL